MTTGPPNDRWHSWNDDKLVSNLAVGIRIALLQEVVECIAPFKRGLVSGAIFCLCTYTCPNKEPMII